MWLRCKTNYRDRYDGDMLPCEEVFVNSVYISSVSNGFDKAKSQIFTNNGHEYWHWGLNPDEIVSIINTRGCYERFREDASQSC